MEYPPLLREMMRVGELKQAALAKRLKVTQPTISRWLKGATPEHDQHERIMAEAYRLGALQHDASSAIEEAPDESPSEKRVKVIGYVGAGAEGHFYAVAPGDLDEVPAPDATDATVALEIRGESLGSFFDRWLVFYDDVRRPVTADLIGKLCIVELADGRVLIKKIRRGKAPGSFDLMSQTEDPIRNVAIEWAAKVKNMEPR